MKTHFGVSPEDIFNQFIGRGPAEGKRKPGLGEWCERGAKRCALSMYLCCSFARSMHRRVRPGCFRYRGGRPNPVARSVKEVAHGIALVRRPAHPRSRNLPCYKQPTCQEWIHQKLKPVELWIGRLCRVGGVGASIFRRSPKAVLTFGRFKVGFNCIGFAFGPYADSRAWL